MKKFILSLSAAVIAATVFAQSSVDIDFAAQGYENAAVVTDLTVGNVTVAFDKGTNNNAPKYYTSGSAVRVYGGGTMTVSCSQSTIESIAVTFGSGDGSNVITVDNGTYDAGTWTGSSNAVIFTVDGTSGHRRIAKLSVTLGVAAEVSVPTFSLSSGNYVGSQSVEITCATEGASIYYTLDGTDPTTESTAYAQAVEITETSTLKAVAIKGDAKSNIATATYTILESIANTPETAYSIADAKALIDSKTKAVLSNDANQVYVKGIISQIDSYKDNFKSIDYWISDDGTTDNQFECYSGKGLDGADFTAVTDIEVGATVVVKGNLTKYNEVYEFTQNNWIVSYTAPVAPIIEPRSWNFESVSDAAKAQLAQESSVAIWGTINSKGRYTMAEKLSDEELKDGEGQVIDGFSGIYFTTSSTGAVWGITNNKYFQHGNFTIRIPACNAGDTIRFGYSGAGSEATISSASIEESISTSSSTKVSGNVVVTAAGDVILTCNCSKGFRLYTVAVSPYVASVAGECKPATYELTGINVAEKAWNYVITEGQQGETLSVVIGDAEAVTIASGTTIFVKPGVKVTITATVGEDTGVCEFTAPDFSFTETIGKPAAKSVDIVGLSYTIPALDNAGSGNGYAVKFRSNQTIDGNTNALVINVNEGLAITGITITGKNNFDTGDITVVSVSADGGDNLLDGEYVMFNAAKDEQVATFSGIAKQQFVICYGAVQATANQYNADVTITWAFADEVAETTNAFVLQTAVKVVPTAISELAAPAENNAAVYDLQGRRANGKGLLIRNGKVVLVK